MIARQVLMPDGVYSGMVYAKPGFDLPVIYEDNHVAIGKFFLTSLYDLPTRFVDDLFDLLS